MSPSGAEAPPSDGARAEGRPAPAGNALRVIASSLAARLSLWATATVMVALAFYGTVLRETFEGHVSERFYRELEAHLAQLTAALEPGEERAVAVVDALSDPRFESPFSGLYWVVRLRGDAASSLSSRSTWDQSPPSLPWPAAPGAIERRRDVMWNGAGLMAVSRTLIIAQGGQERTVQLAILLDQRELTQALASFDARSLQLILLLAGLMIIAVSVQIGFGLAPLRRLRAELQQVARGGADTLSGRFPSELQKLADALNALLQSRGAMIAEARAEADDLAHGLKTPLAVMAAEARKLDAAGHAQAGSELQAQIERMRRQVERRLAQVSARGRAQALGQTTAAASALDRLIRAMRVAPGGDAIHWENAVDPDLRLAIDPIDFDEIAGNLLDNARKWASGRVVLRSARVGAWATLVIEDDGPGAPAADLERLARRGARLDEAIGGTGLGLAIAADLLGAYGGALSLQRSDLGGLAAQATLPIGARGPGLELL